MIHKLDPRLPIVWRDPHTVQLGVDPAVVRLDNISSSEERMLAALAVGITTPGLNLIAQARAGERADLLRRLAPALVVDAPPAPINDLVALSGGGSFVEALRDALTACGLRIAVADDQRDLAEIAPAVAVLVAQHVVPPHAHGFWLRRDVAHLPVVIGDNAVTIGPFIRPGEGPCLLCVELTRRDADAAWPAIATQLLGRAAAVPAPALVLDAAGEACRLVLAQLDARRAAVPGGRADAVRSVRIDALTGARDVTQWRPHPECGCRGIPDPELASASADRSRTGSVDASRGPADRMRTSSAPTDGGPG